MMLLLLFLLLQSIPSNGLVAPYFVSIKNPAATAYTINLAEVTAFDDSLSKVYATSCSLSSLCCDNAFPASYCIDGDMVNFCGSGADANAQLLVQYSSTFTSVVVTNRVECCQDRIVGAQFQIYDSVGTIVYTSTFVGSASSYTFSGFSFTIAPTSTPTTNSPTVTPSANPTCIPSAVPTYSPTSAPSTSPTYIPTEVPTHSPTATPTATPTYIPTVVPTHSPTATPTSTPTYIPSGEPTSLPTATPTTTPTYIPTVVPTHSPTATPTATPTYIPSGEPTYLPSFGPTTISPTATPTANPTYSPTAQPTAIPSPVPAANPTRSPTSAPTTSPSPIPTSEPTQPTQLPTPKKGSIGVSYIKSTTLTRSAVSCLAEDNDVSFVITRGYLSRNSSRGFESKVDPNVCKHLKLTKQANLTIRGVYVEAIPYGGIAAVDPVRLLATRLLGACARYITDQNHFNPDFRVWLGVSTHPNLENNGWMSSYTANRQWFEKLIISCKRHFYADHCGILTSVAAWETVFDDNQYYNSTVMRGLPLWYSVSNGQPNFNDYRSGAVSIGQWSEPVMKQYRQSVDVCGVTVGLNWLR